MTNDFSYNVRSEVIGAAMGTNSYSYVFDPIGSRLAATNNADGWVYLTNPLNQYTNIMEGTAPSAPLHDPDGNMTATGDGWQYVWNAENRMVLASSDTTTVTYAYDHQGRMVAKAVDDVARQYLWDGYNIVRALTHSPTHTLTNSFLWGLDLSGSLQGAGGVGGLLAEVQDGVPYFAAFDANGNVTEYISTNGVTVAHYEYSPFGEITAQSGDLADTFTHRFSTKPWCGVTRLSEYLFRKYGPGMGRWMSRDPTEEDGGENLYGYVGNDPQTATDCLGLLPMGTILDCRKGDCRLEAGTLLSRPGLPWLNDMAFLTKVATSLLFTHDNYIESGFPVYGQGNYGGIVYFENALEKVNEAKKRLDPLFAEAESTYRERLKKIDTLNFSPKEKDRQRELARKMYLARVLQLKGTLVGSGGVYGNRTPLRLFDYPDMISNYHTHTITGPPSGSDRSVLLAIQNKLKTDNLTWAVYSWPDRKSTDDCRKSEIKVYSTGSPSVGGGGVLGIGTGVFIRY